MDQSSWLGFKFNQFDASSLDFSNVGNRRGFSSHTRYDVKD